MYNVFNMGIGMIVIVKPEDVEKTLDVLVTNNQKATVIGNVVDEEGIHFQ